VWETSDWGEQILQWRQQEGERGESMTGCGMRPKYTKAQRASRTWGKGHFTLLGPVAPKLRTFIDFLALLILPIGPGSTRFLGLWTGLKSNYGALLRNTY
jgi:hypothetical protein